VGVMKRLYTARMLGTTLLEDLEPLEPATSRQALADRMSRRAAPRPAKPRRAPITTDLGTAGAGRPWPGMVPGKGAPFDPGHLRGDVDLAQPREPETEPDRPPATRQLDLFD
jgi:hypothetical protein